MIDLVNLGVFGTATTRKSEFVSNPIKENSFSKALSNNGSIFSVSKDEVTRVMEDKGEKVAYTNPFSFESLFGNSSSTQSSTVSAFDA